VLFLGLGGEVIIVIHRQAGRQAAMVSPSSVRLPQIPAAEEHAPVKLTTYSSITERLGRLHKDCCCWRCAKVVLVLLVMCKDFAVVVGGGVGGNSFVGEGFGCRFLWRTKALPGL
jgi:hypothetical protein